MGSDQNLALAMPNTASSTQRVHCTSTDKRNHRSGWPLHDIDTTRQLEQQAQSSLPPNTLMQRAGLAAAQLAMAIAPHAQRIWIACGPGNNGGDGLEAAVHLQHWGKTPIVTCCALPEFLPKDAHMAWQKAKQAGVQFEQTPPAEFDLAIDALLGIGCNKPPEGELAEWLLKVQHASQYVLHIDTPSGLLCDTGEWIARPAHLTSNAKRHTLSLLTLKPGLFTAEGRDASGQVWFNDLGLGTQQTGACA